MGQRTMTFTTYINSDGEKENRAYYNQWGIGRVQLNAIMGNFLAQLGTPAFNLSGSKGFYDETSGFENIKGLDFSKIEDCKSILDHCDNNNGAVVAIADDTTEEGTLKIGFLLGDEECHHWDNEKGKFIVDEPSYSRFVSFDEWAEKVGGKYVDHSYKDMFNAFCEHFKVEIIGEKPVVGIAGVLDGKEVMQGLENLSIRG